MFQVEYKVGSIVNNTLVYNTKTEWVESKQLDLGAKKVRGVAVDTLRVISMDVSARPTVTATVKNVPSLEWVEEEEMFRASFRGSKWYGCTISPMIDRLFTKLRDDRNLHLYGGFVPNTPRDLLYDFYNEYNKEFENEPRTLAVLSRSRQKVNMYGVFKLRHRR